LLFQTFLSFLVRNLRFHYLSRRFMNVSAKRMLRDIVKALFLFMFFDKFLGVFDYWWLAYHRLRILLLIEVKWNLPFLSLGLWLHDLQIIIWVGYCMIFFKFIFLSILWLCIFGRVWLYLFIQSIRILIISQRIIIISI